MACHRDSRGDSFRRRAERRRRRSSNDPDVAREHVNRTEKSCCSCSVRIISAFGKQSVGVATIAVAVPMRSGWPARQPSPKNPQVRTSRRPLSFPVADRTQSFTLPQIAPKPYLPRVTPADIQRTITEFRLDVRIVRENSEDRLLFEQSAQSRWLILKLLDDDFLGSVMTNKKYEVNSKSALRGQ